MPSAADMRVVVIGASAAGLKAAARARRLMERASIVVLDARASISCAACGLPYYLSGDIQRLEALRETPYGVARDPSFFANVKGIDVRTGVRVTRIDREGRKVESVVLATGEPMSVPYDKLVLATGAGAIVPPGVELGGAITSLLTPEDVEPLRRGLETGKIGSAIVVGAGLIGCEAALALSDLWGCTVTVVEAADRVLPQMLDREMGSLVAKELERAGVNVIVGAPVTRAVTVDGTASVTVQRGAADGAAHGAGAPAGEVDVQTLTADRAIVAVGVTPNVDLGRAAGLAIGRRGGLQVDEYLRTSDPSIFAAGDCIEVIHQATEQPVLMPLGSLANKQGRVVGDNLAGRASRFGPVVGAACVKVANWNVAVAGLTEAAARAAGLAPRAAWGAFMDRPHYYPEHALLLMKLVYEERTQRLLGLQAAGPGNAVKRADVFASLLQRDGRLSDLLDLEFCYAPPYNNALDPLHGLGSVALNVEEGLLCAPLPDAEPGGRFVIDLRLPDEITGEAPMLAGAVNVPIVELRQRTSELPTGRPLLLACAMGPRSAEAARYLSAIGWDDVAILAGGMAMRHGA